MADDVTGTGFHRNLISAESTSYFPPGSKLLGNKMQLNLSPVARQPPSFGMVPPEYRSPSPIEKHQEEVEMQQVRCANLNKIFFSILKISLIYTICV